MDWEELKDALDQADDHISSALQRATPRDLDWNKLVTMRLTVRNLRDEILAAQVNEYRALAQARSGQLQELVNGLQDRSEQIAKVVGAVERCIGLLDKLA